MCVVVGSLEFKGRLVYENMGPGVCFKTLHQQRKKEKGG